MAMIDIADVGMLFVRCRGGISHHPDEHVELADADAGARVLLRLIENFVAGNVRKVIGKAVFVFLWRSRVMLDVWKIRAAIAA